MKFIKVTLLDDNGVLVNADDISTISLNNNNRTTISRRSTNPLLEVQESISIIERKISDIIA